ncbi:MAG TPA: hypothetical protein DEO65_16775 [Bacillus bacterium]|nr:hypothetical protein [Bacillus sp. (in: firmicutes)]
MIFLSISVFLLRLALVIRFNIYPAFGEENTIIIKRKRPDNSALVKHPLIGMEFLTCILLRAVYKYRYRICLYFFRIKSPLPFPYYLSLNR